jgi:hypothetical protein
VSLPLPGSSGDLFHEADFDGHGLSCKECHVVFEEGQPIARRVDGVEAAGYLPGATSPVEPLFWVTLICVACSLSTNGDTPL